MLSQRLEQEKRARCSIYSATRALYNENHSIVNFSAKKDIAKNSPE